MSEACTVGVSKKAASNKGLSRLKLSDNDVKSCDLWLLHTISEQWGVHFICFPLLSSFRSILSNWSLHGSWLWRGCLILCHKVTFLGQEQIHYFVGLLFVSLVSNSIIFENIYSWSILNFKSSNIDNVRYNSLLSVMPIDWNTKKNEMQHSPDI